MPVLNTGTRLEELLVNVKSGFSVFDHAAPASKNGRDLRRQEREVDESELADAEQRHAHLEVRDGYPAA